MSPRKRDFRAGCPIVAVAVETNDDAPQLARSAAEIHDLLVHALRDRPNPDPGLGTRP
ncbi:LmrA/YxaF family transcription factor [Nonomuraea guangzhouensis]|uniref:Transcriptional regulator LmrA/YxaF-like C-terminal domain-containing protein n=1 Tax=Nonomuraea guangzhouensis TaxID=1291555 RepID=A0ABW4GYF2_9ACTN|nr:hypothetical protein [Nonomuraea guangzhouensis]